MCPEKILPGECLPCVWGNSPERLETLEDVQAAMDLIMRHWYDVLRSLPQSAMGYAPLYDEDGSTGEILREFSCCGFERAIRLRADTLESGVGVAAVSVYMMLALYDLAEGQSDLPKASVKTLTEETST